MILSSAEFTQWQDKEFLVGFLNAYPEYLTQGYSKLELMNNLESRREDIELKDVVKGAL
jgi:hypothetical protein